MGRTGERTEGWLTSGLNPAPDSRSLTSTPPIEGRFFLRPTTAVPVGTLYLVGMGLNPGDIGDSAIDVISGCASIFCETYTSLMPGLDLARLERIGGGKVAMLERGRLEEGSVVMDALAGGDVALLVPGDPMVSTTHISLRVQAAYAGHQSRVLHSSSILSAAMGESCLQATRFGRTATISFLTSIQPYDVLAENLSRGLHTLFLLDLDTESGRYMRVQQALLLLLDVEGKTGLGILEKDTLAIGLARIGALDQLVVAGSIENILETDFGSPPHSLVIPGELHFTESEAIEVLLKPS